MAGHASVDTDTLMGIANEMAGFGQTPPDSRVYYPGVGIRTVLIGAEISAGELLYARQYGIDAVIAHHPLGLPEAWRCFASHVDQLVRAGVPREEAEAAVAPRLEELELRGQAENFDRLGSLARLLDLPLLNIHQPFDEVGRRLLQDTIDTCLAGYPQATVGQVAESIGALPEFRAVPTRVLVPVGSADAPAGRTVISLGAYTDGGAPVASAYFRHGIGTLVYSQVDPGEALALRREATGNLIVAGRVAGDAVGINAYVERLERLGLEVVRTAGAIAG